MNRKELSVIGFLLLILLLCFFYPSTIGKTALLPADLIYDRDPLWQTVAPYGFTIPSNTLLSDQVAQFYPWRNFAQQSILHGEFPLWNPYTGGGQPFLGNAQSSLFDPLTFITWPLPLWAGFVVTALLRMWVAGFFTYLFSRTIGLHRVGATIASLTFMFCGPLVVWVGYPLASVICWLPALLWATERTIVNRQTSLAMIVRSRSGLAISLFVALQFLAGHPETSFLVLLTWLCYLLFRLWYTSASMKMLGQRVVYYGSVAGLGTALAAIQLVPFLETLWYSSSLAKRVATDVDIPTLLMGEWQVWPGLLTALLPNFFGTPQDHSYWLPSVNYNELTIYIGVLPLALAIIALLHHKWADDDFQHRNILFFTSITILSLGIAFGLPLINGINELPLFNISSNGRLRLIYGLSMAILSGIGSDMVLKHGTVRLRLIGLLLILAVSNLLLGLAAYVGFWYMADEMIASGRAYFAGLIGTPHLYHPQAYYDELAELRQTLKLALYHPTNVMMYLPILIMLLYTATIRWIGDKRPKIIIPILLLTLVGGDLFLTWRGYNPSIEVEALYPTPSALAYVNQDRDIFRINATGTILNPNTSMIFDLEDIRGYDPMLPGRYVELIQRLEGFYPIGEHLYFTTSNDRLLDLLNVKYLLTDQTPGERWQLVDDSHESVHVYKNPDAMPRAFIVHDIEVVDATAILNRLDDGSFDFRQTALLEEAPSDGWMPGPLDPDASAEIIAYGIHDVEVKARTDTPGLLVLSDTYAPGWQVAVNGIVQPILVANYALRAVPLPAGTHDVRFSYRPLSFNVGLGITTAVLGMLLMWIFYLWYDRQRRVVQHVRPQ